MCPLALARQRASALRGLLQESRSPLALARQRASAVAPQRCYADHSNDWLGSAPRRISAFSYTYPFPSDAELIECFMYDDLSNELSTYVRGGDQLLS